MTFINTLLLLAFLHVPSYCWNICSCSCSRSSCPQMSTLFSESTWESVWTYPFQGMLFGMVIFLIFYYKMLYSKKLISHEKLGLILDVINKTLTPLILVRHLLEEIIGEGLSETSALKLKQVLEHIIHFQECNENIQAFGHMDENTCLRSHTMEYELYTYISSVVNHCKVYAGMRGIELELHKSSGYARCWMNVTSMSAVLESLIKKMIDDTPSEGHIDIVVSHSLDSWKLRLVNDSRGAAGNNSRLSELVSAYLPEYYWGSLQIVKKTIRLHGGKLIARKAGKGSCFEVILPIGEKHGAKENRPMIPAIVGKGNVSPEIPCVLLVMADKELSDFLNERLADDFCVTVLSDPEKVFSFCGRQMPDTIIIDEKINGTEGDQLCTSLKSHELLGDIPLILLVNSGDDKSHLAHIVCGAEKVEPRSVSIFRLKADIRAVIEHRRLRYERIKSFLASHSGDTSKEGEKKKKGKATFQERLWELLEKNLCTEGYSIKTLSTDMGMSRTSFYNKMKKITDLAPEDYVFMFKMEKAKILLATQQHNVTEVAAMVGFCDAKYFGKRFKKLYNVSPSDYMRSIT